MTVESTTRRAQYDTNGTTGPWTVPFYFLANADLEVIHTDAAGVETTLTLTTHYSVTGAGVPSGGAVTTVASYASGGTITVLRSVAILQETDYVETDAFPAAAHETALDRLTMIAQQQAEALDRTLTFPASDEASPAIPSATSRASKLLGFDASGNVAVVAPASQDASALALSLASSVNAGSGAGQVGVRRGVDYPFDTAGFLLVRNGSPVNVFNAFTSKAEVEAVRAKTSTTDHYAILLDVLGNEQHVYFPYGRFNSSASLAMGSHAVSIDGVKGAEIRGTDGAYDLLSYTGAQRFHVKNITLRSTNTVNPALRLLRCSLGAAYFDIEGCQFYYGADGLIMDGCYIARTGWNHFNNCDTFLEWTDASASVADYASLGDSFGTSNMGTDDLVKIAGPGAVMTQASFETQYLTKPSLHVITGAQNFYLEGSFITSGEVVYDTSTGGIARIRSQNSYSSANNRFLRVAGGATLDISGSRLQQDSLIPGVFGVSCSGDLIAHGVQMYKWATAISCSGALSLHGGQYNNNTTAISASGTGAIVEPMFSGNTTNYSAGAAVAVKVTAKGSATFNPTSLADGAGETTTVTVTGAALGDLASASFSLDLQGITVTAWVSAANTVSVRFQNETGGTIDLGSGTIRAVVSKA